MSTDEPGPPAKQLFGARAANLAMDLWLLLTYADAEVSRRWLYSRSLESADCIGQRPQ